MITEIKINDRFTVKKFNGGEKQVAVISLSPFMVQDVETNEQYVAKLRLDSAGLCLFLGRSRYFYMSVYVGKDLYCVHFGCATFPLIQYKEYQYSGKNVVRNTTEFVSVYPNSEERDKDYNALVRGEIIKQEANLSTNHYIDIDTHIEGICKVRDYIKDYSEETVWAERKIERLN